MRRPEVSEAKRLKTLEEENRKLKKLLAEQVMDNATERDARKKLLTPTARRAAVKWAIEQNAFIESFNGDSATNL